LQTYFPVALIRGREAAIFTLEMLQEAACEFGKIIQKVGVPFIFALKRSSFFRLICIYVGETCETRQNGRKLTKTCGQKRKRKRKTLLCFRLEERRENFKQKTFVIFLLRNETGK
jgi:hypothetical protein